mmetsp:Transcript_31361/g.66563  ORF Transcript_31361/g.66563 Transcript_31361/m.66563 type:complete len:511 (-) Transcript_31361:203-1735(-)
MNQNYANSNVGDNNEAPAVPVIAPTCRDVLNGRGQGVQRHPGNEKYRKLVFVNKGLYAKCPKTDKIKISRGIVAAVRELGGRFLEMDERTQVYYDIGDKKATEKTSQALREGLSKIRKQMFQAEETSGNSTNIAGYDTSLLTASMTSETTVPASNGTIPQPSGKGVSQEGYFGYSVQVLEALYNADQASESEAETPANETAAMPPPPVAARHSPPEPQPPSPPPQVAPTAAQYDPLGIVADQFPTAVMLQEPLRDPDEQRLHRQQRQQQQQQRQYPDEDKTEKLRSSTGSWRNSFNRLSLGSSFSIRSILNSSNRNSAASNERGTMDSILTVEIQELIRQSEAQLRQVDIMNIDDLIPSEQDLACFDEDTLIDKDRVSDLSFPSRGSPQRDTNYTRTSLMDASLMTIPQEDMMSVHSDNVGTSNESSKKIKTSDSLTGSVIESSNDDERISMMSLGSAASDRELARLLLRMSNDEPSRGRQSQSERSLGTNRRESLMKTNGKINLFGKGR